jgi:spore coat polysaccharide biosynthesis protein SpsF
MGSTRLPGKVMLPLADKPLVGQIFDRLEAIGLLDGVVLATTVDPRNDPLVDYALSRGLVVYRETGEDDIAGRLAGAAAAVEADAILKVNADCPMIDPVIVERIVKTFLAEPVADYASNKIEWTWPEGMSAEAIGTPALQWCDRNLRASEDRELVANWIRDHTERFRCRSVTSEDGRVRGLPVLSVDTPADYALAQKIFAALGQGGRIFGIEEILGFLDPAKEQVKQ